MSVSAGARHADAIRDRRGPHAGNLHGTARCGMEAIRADHVPSRVPVVPELPVLAYSRRQLPAIGWPAARVAKERRCRGDPGWIAVNNSGETRPVPTLSWSWS